MCESSAALCFPPAMWRNGPHRPQIERDSASSWSATQDSCSHCGVCADHSAATVDLTATTGEVTLRDRRDQSYGLVSDSCTVESWHVDIMEKGGDQKSGPLRR